MSPLQTALALVGFKKQTAKGSIAAAPEFCHGVSGGPILLTEIEQAPREVTTAKRLASAADRTGAANGADFQTFAYPKSIGGLLLAAMGAVSTSGTGPYVHTFTTGDVLAYWTFFRKFAGAITAVRDVKVDELTLKWEGPKPLEVEVSGPGTKLSWPATFVPTADETGALLVFTPVGGTLLIDVDGATPAAATITAGEFKIANGADTITPSEVIEADDVSEARQEHECSFTVVPSVFDDWRAALTSTAAGAAITAVVVYGSFSMTFKAGTETLVVTATKVPFTIAHPDADPAGGNAEFEIVGMPIESGGAAVTFVLTNSQVSY